MSPALIFILLLILCFGVMLYFLKSSRSEIAVQRHLANIAEAHHAKAIHSTILKEERLSPVPWVHDLLMKIPGTAALLRLIKQAGAAWWASSLILYSVIAAFFGALLASIWMDRFALILLAGITIGLLPIAYLYFLRHSRLQACDRLLPEAVDLMARALRAGHALSSALEMVSHEVAEPLASEFRVVYEEQTFGLPLRDAMLNLLQRIPRDDMRFLTTALLLQKETGGNLALILDKTSFVMRERSRLRGQIKIYTAQARVTGWVICGLPFLLMALLSIINHGYESLLFSDPLGLRMVYGGLFMLGIGIVIIRKIIDIKI